MTISEKEHPFAVRLGWVALLVAIAFSILGIYFGRHLNSVNHNISKNQTDIQQADTRVRKTNAKLIAINQTLQESDWVRCMASRHSRMITINNAKSEKKLYDYLNTVTQNSLQAAQIVVRDSRTLPAARIAAKQRIVDDVKLLDIVPHVIVPPQIKPCGPNPHPAKKHSSTG